MHFVLSGLASLSDRAGHVVHRQLLFVTTTPLTVSLGWRRAIAAAVQVAHTAASVETKASAASTTRTGAYAAAVVVPVAS